MKAQAHILWESSGGPYLLLPGKGNGQPVAFSKSRLKTGFPQEPLLPVKIGHLEKIAILLNQLQFHLGIGHRLVSFGAESFHVVKPERLHRVHLKDAVHHQRQFLTRIHVNVLHAGREEEH